MGYMEKLAAEKKAVKALYDKGMENLTKMRLPNSRTITRRPSVCRSASTCSKASTT